LREQGGNKAKTGQSSLTVIVRTLTGMSGLIQKGRNWKSHRPERARFREIQSDSSNMGRSALENHYTRKKKLRKEREEFERVSWKNKIIKEIFGLGVQTVGMVNLGLALRSNRDWKISRSPKAHSAKKKKGLP